MLNNALIIGKYVLIGLASIRGAVDTYSAGKWAYAKGFGKKGEAPGSHTAANNTQQEAHVA